MSKEDIRYRNLERSSKEKKKKSTGSRKKAGIHFGKDVSESGKVSAVVVSEDERVR